MDARSGTTDRDAIPREGRACDRSGEPVDFDRTFDAVYPRLVRYCHRLSGDADVAEDVAQEAMVRLFEHAVEGDDAGVRAWLFKTATHLIRDRYRVEENRRRLLRENPVTPSKPDSPEEALQRSDDRTRVREALDELPARDQEILLLRYAGFSYKEIADTVAVAATSVGTLLARAERRFTEVMTSRGEAV